MINILKKVTYVAVIMISFNVLADGADKICGEDERKLSKDPMVGRATKLGTVQGGCTVTMISNSCVLTAGHCTSVLEQVQFNTPYSINRVPQESDPNDVYLVDKSSIKFQRIGNDGRDWAIFKLKKNTWTKKYPGEVQGYYPVSFKAPKLGDIVSITGYGTDYKGTKGVKGHLSQQTHSGEILNTQIKLSESNWGGSRVSKSVINYNTDTMPGNSGSAIVLEATGEIIGVHTYGTCNSKEAGHNGGTMFEGKMDLQAAINNCLASEKN